MYIEEKNIIKSYCGFEKLDAASSSEMNKLIKYLNDQNANWKDLSRNFKCKICECGLDENRKKRIKDYIESVDDLKYLRKNTRVSKIKKKLYTYGTYVEYLKQKGKDCPYEDPDRTYTDANSEYYGLISKFLNAREQWLHGNDKRPVWEFKFKNGESEDGAGIEVRESGKKILCLRTDQFGFTPPSEISIKTWDLKHPYARILDQCKDKYEFVAGVVYHTRTIGGSFVWPLTEGRNFTQYNKSRGINTYIEDRVDITLYEILHFYEWIEKEKKKRKPEDETVEYLYKNDLLFTSEMEEKNNNGKGTGKKKVKSSMETWLRHFGSFENYIDFFMLNDFVTEVATEGPGKKYRPKCIFKDQCINDDYIQGIITNKPIEENAPVRTAAPCTLEEVLNNLSTSILERSKKMEYCINCKKCLLNSKQLNLKL